MYIVIALFIYINVFFLLFKLQLWYTFTTLLVNSTNNILFIFFSIAIFSKLNISILIFFFIFKYKLFIYTSDPTLISKSLIVGLNVIHPPLFYLCFFLGSIKFFESLFFCKFINIFVCASVALLLGGLWGLGNSV